MLFNGGKLKFPAVQNGDTGTMIRDYSIKYIEIPLSLKMRTNDINGMRFFGRIGLGTAFKLSAKKTDEFTPRVAQLLQVQKPTMTMLPCFANRLL